MSAVQQITGWPVPHAAAAVITPDGVVDTWGPQEMVFELASVTKLLTSVAVLVALQDGALTLTTVAGPQEVQCGMCLRTPLGMSLILMPPVGRRGAAHVFQYGF